MRWAPRSVLNHGKTGSQFLERFCAMSRSVSSARTQRYRARQRAGVAVLAVPVPAYDTIQALIEADRLSVADALDQRKVALAVGEVVTEWSRRWLKIL